MSLKVWFPLDGTIDNQGLEPVKIENMVATVDASGKIGSCYSFSSSSNLADLTGLDMGGWPQFSLCFWAYCPGGSIDNVITAMTSNGYVQFAVFDSKIRFRDSRHSSITDALTITQPTADTWTHYAIEYDNGDWFVYKDAVLVNSKTYTNSATMNTGVTRFQFCRYKTSSYDRQFNGKLNDFRIYDHCLSLKEIKELNKALVLHYPLDGGSFGNPNMILESYYSDSPWTSGAYTGKEVYKGVVAKKVSVAKLYTNSASTNRNCFPSMTFEPNTRYTVSVDWCDHLRTDDKNTKMYLRFRYDDDSFSTNMTSPNADNDGNWVHSKVTSGAGKTVTMLANSYGNGGTVSIANLKVEKGAADTGFAPQADQYYVSDDSGYKRDGNVVGSTLLASGSPRYERHTQFDGSSYIQTNSVSTEVRTVSFWVNWDSLPTGTGYAGQSVVFVDQKSKMGFGIYPSGLICTTNSVAANMFSKSGISAGTWYHIAIVNTGSSPTSTTRDLYIDGVKQTPLTSTNYWGYSLDYLQVGKRSTTSDGFSGKLSDFRMYATALSEDDIKELYDTGACIDNKQNLFSYEMVEDSSSDSQIDKTGLVRTNGFYEYPDDLASIYKEKIVANQIIEI